MSTGTKVLLVIAILLGLSQFIQPKKNQDSYNLKPFFEDTNASAKVQTLIFNACSDCHSNQSKYPWYSSITPFNFWIANHINEGKEHLNLSEWNLYNNNQKYHALHEFYEEVEHKKMPLKTYTIQHPEAKLNDNEIKLLVDWAKKAKEKFE